MLNVASECGLKIIKKTLSCILHTSCDGKHDVEGGKGKGWKLKARFLMHLELSEDLANNFFTLNNTIPFL